jgi:hypothetical protein
VSTVQWAVPLGAESRWVSQLRRPALQVCSATDSSDWEVWTRHGYYHTVRAGDLTWPAIQQSARRSQLGWQVEFAGWPLPLGVGDRSLSGMSDSLPDVETHALFSSTACHWGRRFCPACCSRRRRIWGRRKTCVVSYSHRCQSRHAPKVRVEGVMVYSNHPSLSPSGSNLNVYFLN